MTVYVAPLYYFDPRIHYGYYLVSFLVIKRNPSGYTIEIKYSDSLKGSLEASSREKAEKLVDKLFGGFIRLLEKAVSTESPNATKLAELIECADELIKCLDGIRMISFLEKIYGDEILNDDIIPGIHSVCYGKTRFFINDKVIMIPDMDLLVVRDIHSGRIFIYKYVYRDSYGCIYRDFYEVPPETKVFYDALFKGFRDLLKSETVVVVKDRRGNIYSVSSTEVEVDGKRVSLVAVGGYDPEKKKLGVDGIIAIICTAKHRDSCSTYFFSHVLFMHEAMDNVPAYIKETVLGYILGSEKIQKKAKNETAEYLIKKHTWEILPA
jgi:hypothetical protein